MKEYQFKNNKDKRRYELDLEDGDIALIDYHITPSGNIILTHTEVPYKHENQGIGKQIVQKSLDDVRAQGAKVVPQCGFVATYIRRHPECSDLVAER